MLRGDGGYKRGTNHAAASLAHPLHPKIVPEVHKSAQQMSTAAATATTRRLGRSRSLVVILALMGRVSGLLFSVRITLAFTRDRVMIAPAAVGATRWLGHPQGMVRGQG